MRVQYYKIINSLKANTWWSITI